MKKAERNITIEVVRDGDVPIGYVFSAIEAVEGVDGPLPYGRQGCFRPKGTSSSVR